MMHLHDKSKLLSNSTKIGEEKEEEEAQVKKEEWNRRKIQ